MTLSDPQLIKELDEQRPATPPALLSKAEKDLLIERAFLGLYRWYVSHSQKTRNWNPNDDFDWRNIRTDHSENLNMILQGFFAVEQYVPDYVLTLLRVIRRSHGRSHFHIRWGAEEERHADLWENALLFSRCRSPQWIEDYKYALRSQQWELPWDDPMYMIFYTVIQERATQVNYINTALIATGKSDHPDYTNETDPVLARAAQVITVDEAAHYAFFLEGARLYLYYYPAEALEALYNVIKFFAMPAGQIIPEYDKFAEVVAQAGVYGPREHLSDVLDVALNQLGVAGRRALYKGIKNIRRVPNFEGQMYDTAIFDLLDYNGVEAKVKRLFERVGAYEQKIGFDMFDPIAFVPSGIEIE